MWCSLAIAILVSVNDASFPPQQIHIALGATPDIMTFNWVTFDNPIITQSMVQLGSQPQPSSLTIKATGKAYLFKDGGSNHTNRTIHLVQVNNLSPSTVYYYQVGDPTWEGGMSATYSFKTAPNAITLKPQLPIKFGIYGDMGNYNDVIIPVLQQTALNNDIDLILHIGDFAYNYQDDQGVIGDDYMNDIQVIATHTPYMVSMGNHESAYNFSHYSFRFMGMPPNDINTTIYTGAGPAPNNWYYSFNVGNVHIVALSTEIYFDFAHLQNDQYQWLVQDLEKANKNRTEAPWIFVHGHRPMYCSTDTNTCQKSSATLRLGDYGLDELFYKYGVDFFFVGHVHNYERMYDIYNGTTTASTSNMSATTYILTGNGGNCEYIAKFQEAKPVWSAYRGEIYGFTEFDVYNDTHINLKQMAVYENGTSGIVDQVWYEQYKHGPFQDNYPNRASHIVEYGSNHKKIYGPDYSYEDANIKSQECPIQFQEYFMSQHA